MDSDSIFYFIFMGGVVFFSFLNSMKKAKAEKEQREQAMRNQQRNQSTASPQNNTSTESKQFDEWFNQAEPEESEPEPEPEPEQPITSLEDLIKALSQPKQKPQPHVAATPPQLPPQPAPQRSIAIEPPENEGQRATAITAAPDDVYSQPADRLPSSSHDWRRAVIAHEILKRKF